MKGKGGQKIKERELGQKEIKGRTRPGSPTEPERKLDARERAEEEKGKKGEEGGTGFEGKQHEEAYTPPSPPTTNINSREQQAGGRRTEEIGGSKSSREEGLSLHHLVDSRRATGWARSSGLGPAPTSRLTLVVDYVIVSAERREREGERGKRREKQGQETGIHRMAPDRHGRK